MDKYEYNLKLEEIDKLVDQADYEEAAKLADTIDWRRVRNVRTLCLISEIYEASGRLDDSKALLMRAYKKSPLGKTILYRLVEVTTALQQYDEAIEFYSEYVQAAPHDNNRYILKYLIYKGRGSSTEELIAILEEYLGQEYTERWAYELAKLYQQAGHMQKCYAACDDLVLWFHSGKYVMKALELKKRYTSLTPKQQQIYEEGLQEEMEEEIEKEQELYEEEPAVLQNTEGIDGEVIAESIMAETEKEIADQVTAHKAEMERSEDEAPAEPANAEAASDKVLTQETKVLQQPEKDLKVEFAKSMREIISGVVKRTEVNEEDIPASVEAKVQPVRKLEIPEVEEPEAGKLSIDDILLSMGEKGKKIAAEAQRIQEEQEIAAAQEAAAVKEAVEKESAEKETAEPEQARAAEEKTELPEEEATAEPVLTMTEAVTDELTDEQREALQYTSNPERLLRNKRALPTYTSEEEVLTEKTIRIPTEKISEYMMQLAEQEERAAQAEAAQAANAQAAQAEQTAQPEMEEPEAKQTDAVQMAQQEAEEAMLEEEPIQEEEAYFDDESEYGYEEAEELMIPEHLRGLFSGFTQIEGLESQIANAIIQVQAKEKDRTSRTGNILIFGAHGSGKTTLAMNIAKAVAQDKGNPVMKIAKIYAADLNRKDIAATIARIAGGTLIIEEAGDLDAKTVEQLTTAMEFRTDGLIVILEDEQQYVHELLMRHPRFTMKFTAQIYIPVYTAEELVMFGQMYAKAQDHVISEDGMNQLYDKISEAAAAQEGVAISDVIQMVSDAIEHSNKFLRKLAMGKKRYDENDYVVLFAKDFK